MTLPVMAGVGAQKGIDVLATGDWTHPLWIREIQSQLEESEDGLYRLKDKGLRINDKDKHEKELRFLLSVEIASIYTQGGKGRRIHNLVLVPSIATAQKINQEMLRRGFNLASDGRPIIGLSSRNLLELILGIDEKSMLIPAHVWTPWFGVYGAMSGFDSLTDAFGDLADKVYGIETGLSSDPEMNWQIEELQNRSILSFSDAHSPAKMGREATVFRLESLSYENIRKAIMQPSLTRENRKLKMGVEDSKSKIDNKIPTQSSIDPNLSSPADHLLSNKVLYTIEFYPEEGKYHYSGHRNCNVTMTPEEQKVSGGICPVCHRKVTDGVMRRVQELAGLPSNTGLAQQDGGQHIANAQGLVWIKDRASIHPPFVKIVPLQEVIAEAIGSPVGSPKIKVIFDSLTKEVGSEFDILLKIPIEEIAKVGGEKVAAGIEKVRQAHIVIQPGYDGVFGVVKIWDKEKNDKGLMINDKDEEETISVKHPVEQVGIDF